MLNQLFAGNKRNLHLKSNWRAGINGEPIADDTIQANGEETQEIEQKELKSVLDFSDEELKREQRKKKNRHRKKDRPPGMLLRKHEVDIKQIIKKYDSIKGNPHYQREADTWFAQVLVRVPAVDEPVPTKHLVRKSEWSDNDDEEDTFEKRAALNRMFKGVSFTGYKPKNRGRIISKEKVISQEAALKKKAKPNPPPVVKPSPKPPEDPTDFTSALITIDSDNEEPPKPAPTQKEKIANKLQAFISKINNIESKNPDMLQIKLRLSETMNNGYEKRERLIRIKEIVKQYKAVKIKR